MSMPPKENEGVSTVPLSCNLQTKLPFTPIVPQHRVPFELATDYADDDSRNLQSSACLQCMITPPAPQKKVCMYSMTGICRENQNQKYYISMLVLLQI